MEINEHFFEGKKYTFEEIDEEVRKRAFWLKTLVFRKATGLPCSSEEHGISLYSFGCFVDRSDHLGPQSRLCA